MEPPSESSIEVLDRLRPVLLAVFQAYRISEEQAREIVAEAGKDLASRKRKPQDPTEDLKRLVAEMLPVFTSRNIHREALAALAFFRQAVETERAGAALVAKVGEFLRNAQHAPDLRLQETEE